MKPDTDNMNDFSIHAWDNLYGSSPNSVWGYDPAPFLRPEIEKLMKDLGPNARILDAGTGEGRHLPLLLEFSNTVHACDASENALMKISPQILPDAYCIQGLVTDLPYKPEVFDLIILCDVFETLNNPEQVLDELSRVLVPKGRLICNIPGKNDSIAGIDMERISEGSFLYREKYLYRFWEENEAVEMLNEHGFEVIFNTTYEWREPPHPGFRNEEHQHLSRVFSLSKRI